MIFRWLFQSSKMFFTNCWEICFSNRYKLHSYTGLRLNMQPIKYPLNKKDNNYENVFSIQYFYILFVSSSRFQENTSETWNNFKTKIEIISIKQRLIVSKFFPKIAQIGNEIENNLCQNYLNILKIFQNDYYPQSEYRKEVLK